MKLILFTDIVFFMERVSRRFSVLIHFSLLSGKLDAIGVVKVISGLMKISIRKFVVSGLTSLYVHLWFPIVNLWQYSSFRSVVAYLMYETNWPGQCNIWVIICDYVALVRRKKPLIIIIINSFYSLDFSDIQILKILTT